ncbi:MAG: hypothetical protein J1F36_00830 [Clostridiales bacterium]|nr:hypothetical protein [Clostridiales bacterium]
MVAALIIVLAVCTVFCVVAETKAILSMVSDLKALRTSKLQQIEKDNNDREVAAAPTYDRT